MNDWPGIAPVVVDSGVGIGVSQEGGLSAYPATQWSP
jgi:hypothetical protein